MSGDLEQHRRTVRVLGLLDESFRAHERGDAETCDAKLSDACTVDVDVVSAVQGGIQIGEIPGPESRPVEWAVYVHEKE